MLLTYWRSTFTNKAAKEMKKGSERILGNTNARNLYIGTFHSVLPVSSGRAQTGISGNFTIYDTDDAKAW